MHLVAFGCWTKSFKYQLDVHLFCKRVFHPLKQQLKSQLNSNSMR